MIIVFLCLVVFTHAIYMIFTLQIFFGEDWLTMEQILGTQAKRMDGDSLYEMLTGFFVKNEDWQTFRASDQVSIYPN